MYCRHHAFRYPRSSIAHPQSSPISRLPTELLVHIFLLTSPDATRWSTDVAVEEERKDWMKLMAVCGLWRDIICNAAVFWTNIHVGSDLRWLELSLAHTQQARNIDISIPSLTLDSTSAMDIMGPYASRIRSLAYLHGEREQSTSRVNMWPAPTLESLSIVNHPFYEAANPQGLDHYPVYPIIQLSAERQPVLHTLSLSGFTVSEDQVMLSRLVSLSLSGWPGGELSGLIAVLRSCVSLRDLAIVNHLGRLDEDEDEDDIPQGAGPVISLPHLRNFKIEHRDPTRVSDFLSHMMLPAHVNISITTEHRSSIEMVDVLPDAEWRDRLAILQCVDRIKVVGDYLKAEYTVLAMQEPATCAPGTAPGRIKILMRDAYRRYFQDSQYVREGVSERLLRNLPRFFPALHMVKTLMFSGDVFSMTGDYYWEGVLTHYPSLRTLVVEDALCKCHAQGLIGALGADEDASLLCPHLEYLWLRNMGVNKWVMSDAANMLFGRVLMKVPLHRLRLELVPGSEDMYGPAITHEEFYVWEPRLRDDVGICEVKLWEGQKSDVPQRFDFANLDIAADLDEALPFNY